MISIVFFSLLVFFPIYWMECSAPDEAESQLNNESDRKESLADISAEIDKLNAEMEHIKPSNSTKSAEEPEAVKIADVAEEASTKTNHVSVDAVTTNGSTVEDDQIKENIALLLAETTVPDLSGVASVKRKLEESVLEEPLIKESTAEGSIVKETAKDPSDGVSDDIKVQSWSFFDSLEILLNIWIFLSSILFSDCR